MVVIIYVMYLMQLLSLSSNLGGFGVEYEARLFESPVCRLPHLWSTHGFRSSFYRIQMKFLTTAKTSL